jgi:hypothetical protein
MLAHLRTEAYTGYQQSIYPPGLASKGAPSKRRNEETTEAVRQRLMGQWSSPSIQPGRAGTKP